MTMLFTGKGDNGTTKIFGCDQRLSKSAAIAEALGTVDELNSFLGILKISGKESIAVDGVNVADIIDDIQQDLFVVQAELAGADKHIDEHKVKKLEALVNDIETELPPITSFFVSGGTTLAAGADFARTICRRAERCVVTVAEEERSGAKKDGAQKKKSTEAAAPRMPSPELLAYMNRLSSLLYALARLANHRAGVNEEKPHY